MENKPALIIIDMWDQYHANHTRFQSITEQTVNRLVKLIKRWQGPVILTCYNTYRDTSNTAEWGKPPGSEVFPWKGPDMLLQHCIENIEFGLVSWDTTEVLNFLDIHNVANIYFAGASYPGCVTERELGANSPKMSKFNNRIIIDCVVNYMSTGYNDYEIIHDAYRHAINHDSHRIVTSDTL